MASKGKHRRRLSVGYTLKSKDAFADGHTTDAKRARNLKREKERKKRRTTICLTPHKMGSANMMAGDRKRVPLMDISARDNTPSKVMGPSDPAKAVTQQPAAPNRGAAMSGVALADLYSQCIKMATANKINQKNTWTLKLIDHMDECVLTRDQGGQLNFQRASCTLDASVQIYSYRVDSVHQSTYKVLGGLSSNKKQSAQSMDSDASDDDGTEPSGRKRSRRKRGINTLEADPANLNVKSVALNLDVDPLFHKMRADFDEGGAHGLLLNHLCSDEFGSLVFDSSSRPSAPVATVDEGKEPAEDVNKSALDAMLAGFTRCAARPLCPGLSGLSAMISSVDTPQATDTESPSSPDTKNAAVDDMFDAEFSDDGGEDFEVDRAMQDELQQQLSPGRPASGAPAVVAPSGTGSVAAPAPRDWSGRTIGLSHWKFRERKRARTDTGAEAGSAPVKTRRRGRRTAKLIDFSLPGPKPDAKVFSVSKRTKNCLSVMSLRRAADDQDANLLPEDLEYDETKLKSLFTKPAMFVVGGRGGGGRGAPHTPATGSDDAPQLSFVNEDGEIAEEVDGDNDDDDEMGGFEDVDAMDASFAAEESNIPISGDTVSPAVLQSPGGQGVLSAETGIGGGLELVAQPRRVDKVRIRYAKFVKSVNVLSLKKKIWGAIEDHPVSTVGDTAEDPAGPSNDGPSNDGPSDDTKEEKKTKRESKSDSKQTFKSVLEGLDGQLKTPQLANTTVPFCFICLLHLCNENNLALEAITDAEKTSDDAQLSDNSGGVADNIGINFQG